MGQPEIRAKQEELPNSRRFSSLELNLPVTGHWWDLEGKKYPLEALLVLLSEGGAQLQCSAPVAANSVIELDLKLGKLKRIAAHGRVHWWRRMGEVLALDIEFTEPNRRVGLYVKRQLAPAPIAKLSSTRKSKKPQRRA
jgi:hypothetical protein